MARRLTTTARLATMAVAATLAGASTLTSADAATTTTPAAASVSGVTHTTGTIADGAAWIADVPQNWNGTVLLYSHGFGPLVAQDAPDSGTADALLARGYALAGSSYDPNGSMWALDTAVQDQFQTLHAVEATVLPHAPHRVLAVGTSMGGLISALEAQDGEGVIDGALSTCGIVGGAVNLNNYQLDGEYAISRLLAPGQDIPLVNLGQNAMATADALQATADSAQHTPAGRARLALAMAFLNVAPWDASLATPAPKTDPEAQELAQYNVEFTGGFSTIHFIESARPSVDQADGGQAAWTAGVDFASALEHSPYKTEVQALYRAAGLDLHADLANLTQHADIEADPAALRSLTASSVPTGHLAVPELDLHTISDQLVPVEHESYYAARVRAAGDNSLLRQAYVASVGHCNFSSAELVAGVEAINQRVATGRWADAATPDSLERSAQALDLGPARYVTYKPGELTGEVD